VFFRSPFFFFFFFFSNTHFVALEMNGTKDRLRVAQLLP